MHRFRPLVSALDAFLYEAPLNTRSAPHIRDAIDVKRWMMIVIFALLPVILMTIWNTGVQSLVYESGSLDIMKGYLTASKTATGYFDFTFSEGRWLTILKLGAAAFLPVMLISYLVGGLCEGIFAAIYGHEIAEGFLVTGMLYPLILPPTIPYWMVAMGVAFGVIIGKELFGGTGMNILNPALTARAFLFFTFPGKMTGDIWAGTNPTLVAENLKSINTQAGTTVVDGFTQATPLGVLNTLPNEVKRIHVEAIASHSVGKGAAVSNTLSESFAKWTNITSQKLTLTDATTEQLNTFLTTPQESGGLGLISENLGAAYKASDVVHGTGLWSDANLFFGNMLGSMGETSTLACLIGAFILIYTGVGAWRTMLAFGLGAFITAFLFQFASTFFGTDGGVWNPVRYSMPAYRHLLMGGLAFGLVYMATDPVSSPGLKMAKWMYGGMIGVVTILIRLINPAYPEGVMLAILFANVFAPLFDYHVLRYGARRAANDRRQLVQ